ncbi:hypothetical protein T23_16570 [Turicibacter faecis]|uniref:Uncharacterized protein n=1 Tax=Turicibacter faecis TaxID=2963365 RepID=A0ABM8IPP0_9FIRM|nr:hypothetical protein T23_16570 [Turicibacter sp. TC023]
METNGDGVAEDVEPKEEDDDDGEASVKFIVVCDFVRVKAKGDGSDAPTN